MDFNTIYVNGGSHVAGHRLSDWQVKSYYKNNHQVPSWKSERGVTFPKRLSDYFNCNLIDDSQCGSGPERVVRQAFEYVSKNKFSQIKNTLFLLVFNIPFHRLEYYCKKINDYLIVNVQYNEDQTFNYVSVVEKFSKTDRKYDEKYFEGEITEDIKMWLTKYHDPMVYMNKILNQILGLLSFLELNNINYYYGFDGGLYIPKFINKNKILNVDGCQTVNEYCDKHKLTLHYELNENSNDHHPGYFGHLKFSEELIKFLEKQL
jgi:hypothetical protein